MEELKKEWSDEFDEQFTDYELDAESQSHTTIRTNLKNFISSLLAKQQDIPMGYSQWLNLGKKFGYHDCWKDMTRIALQEEFVNETIKLMKREYMRGLLDADSSKYPLDTRLEQLEERYKQYIEDNPSVLADIKSKLNI